MFSRLILSSVAVSSTLLFRGSPTPSCAESELRQRTQELLDAVAPGDVGVWRTRLHERMVHVDENGIVRDKAALLAELRPLPAGLKGSLRVASFLVQRHGEVAVATHEDREDLIYFGQTLRSRFRTTDTWLCTEHGWRLIGAQVLAVPEDPPPVKLSATELCAYEGRYALTREVTATVRAKTGSFTSNAPAGPQPCTGRRPPTCSSRRASRVRGESSSATPPERSRGSSIGARDTTSPGGSFSDRDSRLAATARVALAIADSTLKAERGADLSCCPNVRTVRRFSREDAAALAASWPYSPRLDGPYALPERHLAYQRVRSEVSARTGLRAFQDHVHEH